MVLIGLGTARDATLPRPFPLITRQLRAAEPVAGAPDRPVVPRHLRPRRQARLCVICVAVGIATPPAWSPVASKHASVVSRRVAPRTTESRAGPRARRGLRSPGR